jgi:hypothetical protein
MTSFASHHRLTAPMRSRHHRWALSTALVGAASVVSVGLLAAPASAATSKTTATTAPLTGVSAVRAQLISAIALRQTALHRVLAATAASKTMDPTDQSVLSASLTQALTEMNALAAKAPTDTTTADVAADHTAMVQNYVLALQVPAADMVMADEYAASIESQMSARLPAIQKLMAPANNQGSPVPAAVKTAYTAFQRELAAANSATGGVSSSLLALLPESYPSNQSVLTSAQSDLANVRHDLGQAVTNLNTIVTNFHH